MGRKGEIWVEKLYVLRIFVVLYIWFVNFDFWIGKCGCCKYSQQKVKEFVEKRRVSESKFFNLKKYGKLGNRFGVVFYYIIQLELKKNVIGFYFQLE